MIKDCDKALQLDPGRIQAYILKGLFYFTVFFGLVLDFVNFVASLSQYSGLGFVVYLEFIFL